LPGPRAWAYGIDDIFCQACHIAFEFGDPVPAGPCEPLPTDGRRRHAPWRRPEDFAHLLEGLRKAGWRDD
jgi:hypothetical protein